MAQEDNTTKPIVKLRISTVIGSARTGSLNRRLGEALMKLGSSDDVEFFLSRIDDLPIYNQDLEANRPEQVSRFIAQTIQADAILIVMPEHNRSIPALLKNAIDWGSRPTAQSVWRGKPVAITGTSPGAIGTAIGQQHLRQILGAIGSLVMGGEAYITYRQDLIDDSQDITVEGTREFLRGYLSNFIALTRLLTRNRRSKSKYDGSSDLDDKGDRTNAKSGPLRAKDRQSLRP